MEWFTTQVLRGEDNGEPTPGLSLTQVPTTHFALDVFSLDEAALGETEDLEPFVGESKAIRDALITATAVGGDLIVVSTTTGLSTA